MHQTLCSLTRLVGPRCPVQLVASVLLALGVVRGVAEAHPHAWIDVSVDVVFDGQGAVTALHETWVFDDFYTEFALQGRLGARHGALPEQAQLDEIMNENLNNLAEYHYFTRVEVKKAPLAFAAATNRTTRMRGRRIEMSFVLPLAKPAKLDEVPLTYMIFDPSYYIEMLHAKEPASVRLVGAPAGCGYKIFQPNPSLNEVAKAAALDRTQSGGNGLGLVFAERVTVQCNAKK